MTTSTSSPTHTTEQLDVIAALVGKCAALGLSVKILPTISVGPIVSLYRLLPTGNTKVSQLESLAQDFAIALHAEDVLIERIPGEAAVGVSVPNKDRKPVLFSELGSYFIHEAGAKRVPLLLGVTWKGEPFIEDLAELPHLFIAGSTGSGKSTLMNNIIGSLSLVRTPASLRFVLFDLKQGIEFSNFVGLPHLMFEPAISIYQSLERLEWCVDRMNRRLAKLRDAGCQNIHQYLAKGKPMAFIVVVIDEVALLLDNDEKNDEKQKLGKIASKKISDIVSLARAAGIYVIAGTQRPSVDVVKGSIKANFPARISFKLPSEADSRTVLTEGGAEHLLSQGDMLYMSPTKPGLLRLHAPFASQSDIKTFVQLAEQKVRTS